MYGDGDFMAETERTRTLQQLRERLVELRRYL
jgi:hypothetical protein